VSTAPGYAALAIFQDYFGAAKAKAEEFRRRYEVTGLSIAIARNEALVFSMGFGSADTQSGRRVKPDSLFRIASVSKPITSTAVFRLIEQGKLKLSDTVFGAGSTLGNDFGAPPYVPGVEAITIEHLLTHTAGGWQNDGQDPMFHHGEMNHHDLIQWTIANQPLKIMPGEKFAYSNFGYCILGRVIEKLTHQPYAEAVQRLVLQPCGIQDMRIAGDTEEARAPNEVTYYASPNTGNPYGMKVARMDSHGGWLSTATDLVKFLTRVDGFPRRPDILRRESIRTMVSTTPASGGYAHGWNTNSANSYWHNGSLPGTTSIAVRTASGYCWAAIANSGGPGSPIDGALDQLMWNMVGSVSIWPDIDLFGR
jgi:CubicO group peptidase (beta-lactamase class C family)